MVLGHPDVLRRFNGVLKVEELEKQSKIEKIISLQNNDITFDFVELAPEIFHSIRKIYNVDEKLVRQIFS